MDTPLREKIMLLNAFFSGLGTTGFASILWSHVRDKAASVLLIVSIDP